MWQSVGRSLRGLLTAVFLLVFCLCALEVGLRIDRYQASCTLTAARSHGALSVEEQLLAPSLTTWTELLPLVRVTLTPPDGGEPIQITTNSFGCRGPEPVLPKPPHLLRVVCLGDETTFAAEVSARETYSAQLQQMLSDEMRTEVEVINAGVPGNCPRQAALQLRHRILALQPDLIVLHFDMSDVFDDAAIQRFVTLDREDNPILAIHPAARKAGQLVGKKLCDEFLVVQQAETALSKFWDQRTPLSDTDRGDPAACYLWTSDHAPDLSKEIDNALAPLLSIRKMCDRAGVKLLVASAPKPWQVSPAASPTREARAVNGIPKEACWSSPDPFKRVLTACRQWEIPAVVAWKEFREAEQAEELFLRTSPQLSAAGHQLYAEVLTRAILGEETAPKSSPGTTDIEPVEGIEPIREWSP